VDPNETIEDVKKKIQDREGVPVNEQILKFDGKKLENPKTLDDCGIKYKDTADLNKEAPVFVTPKATKPKVDSTYIIQMSPWADPLEEGYSPKGKIERPDGHRAKSKEQLKNRYHTDLASEIEELRIREMKKKSFSTSLEKSLKDS
jgi:hypothetical protein